MHEHKLKTYINDAGKEVTYCVTCWEKITEED